MYSGARREPARPGANEFPTGDQLPTVVHATRYQLFSAPSSV